ncbi:hypothetical protein [Candidatus Phycosocius spiralis]|uniref:Uncharacterized protein n=1 Tax=Candidatus Phycosocius spiralis TaxID=2815099 RepID=A0ABQ4PT82_9PROT|nr:hypothetical protein [Candidatus Phycosocius spiralis]GIU66210.1 hypothetical protein PsB1_0364 [Candidatus Phycosocius spiralis]
MNVLKVDEIYHAARLLQGHYGEDGAVIAVMRASEATALGDRDLADYWQAVAEAIDSNKAPDPYALN